METEINKNSSRGQENQNQNGRFKSPNGEGVANISQSQFASPEASMNDVAVGAAAGVQSEIVLRQKVNTVTESQSASETEGKEKKKGITRRRSIRSLLTRSKEMSDSLPEHPVNGGVGNDQRQTVKMKSSVDRKSSKKSLAGQGQIKHTIDKEYTHSQSITYLGAMETLLKEADDDTLDHIVQEIADVKQKRISQKLDLSDVPNMPSLVETITEEDKLRSSSLPPGIEYSTPELNLSDITGVQDSYDTHDSGNIKPFSSPPKSDYSSIPSESAFGKEEDEKNELAEFDNMYTYMMSQKRSSTPLKTGTVLAYQSTGRHISPPPPESEPSQKNPFEKSVNASASLYDSKTWTKPPAPPRTGEKSVLIRHKGKVPGYVLSAQKSNVTTKQPMHKPYVSPPESKTVILDKSWCDGNPELIVQQRRSSSVSESSDSGVKNTPPPVLPKRGHVLKKISMFEQVEKPAEKTVPPKKKVLQPGQTWSLRTLSEPEKSCTTSWTGSESILPGNVHRGLRTGSEISDEDGEVVSNRHAPDGEDITDTAVTELSENNLVLGSNAPLEETISKEEQERRTNAYIRLSCSAVGYSSFCAYSGSKEKLDVDDSHESDNVFNAEIEKEQLEKLDEKTAENTKRRDCEKGDIEGDSNNTTDALNKAEENNANNLAEVHAYNPGKPTDSDYTKPVPSSSCKSTQSSNTDEIVNTWVNSQVTEVVQEMGTLTNDGNKDKRTAIVPDCQRSVDIEINGNKQVGGATEQDRMEKCKISSLEALNDARDSPSHKDGTYFLSIMHQEKEHLNSLCNEVEADLEDPNITEDASGKVRAAIGKAHLLVGQKFKQFEGLCEKNLSQDLDDPFQTTGQDLAGFWDMVVLQVEDIESMFKEIEEMKRNNWTEVPKTEIVERKSSFKSTTPRLTTKHSAKSSQHSGSKSKSTKTDNAARAANLAKLRDEARRQMLAAKRAEMRHRKSSSGEEDIVEIFAPDSPCV